MNKRKKENYKLNAEFIGFIIISGLISFNYNMVMIIIPLRMTDHGLSYGMIGGAMSGVAIGLIIIKLFIGHLSDIFGTKKFILFSLIGLSAVTFLLAKANTFFLFMILLAAMGIFRGIFLAVNGSCIMNMAENDEYGKVYGVVQGVSSFLASIGGMISGVLYHFKEGEYALYICTAVLIITSIWTAMEFKSKDQVQKESLPILKILKSINKRIVIFCIVVFIQSFVAGPMWNFIIPMYCYHILLFSPALLGILMSMDELISSPTYILAGRIVDKVDVVKFNVLFLCLTAFGGLMLANFTSPVLFIVIFLMCSISISCTFVGIPKERVKYIRKEQKGFELALISLCGGIGDAMGSNVLGRVAERYTIHQSIYLFSVAYIIMAILIIVPVIYRKRKENHEDKLYIN